MGRLSGLDTLCFVAALRALLSNLFDLCIGCHFRDGRELPVRPSGYLVHLVYRQFLEVDFSRADESMSSWMVKVRVALANCYAFNLLAERPTHRLVRQSA